MERNWLIRTTQNQILGPVAKTKLLEFLQKGALGLNDEVTSGNGYWISLKEKDLVEKYLYGDVPQGYNPISESKSVLSQRENPDKTTSLNTAPPNKTQILIQGESERAAVPNSADLEYPDITLVSTTPLKKSAEENVKLPDHSDLEFPDITIVASAPKKEAAPIVPEMAVERAAPKAAPVLEVAPVLSSEDVIYPKSDDLDYPDLGPTSQSTSNEAPKEGPVQDEEFTFVVEKSGPKKDLKIDLDQVPSLSLDVAPAQPKEVHVEEQTPSLSLAKKTEKKEIHPHEEKKLLHERKVKSKNETKKEPEAPRPQPDRTMPEHLKKRNDNYLLYLLIIVVVIILALFFYYYRNILNKPLPV